MADVKVSGKKGGRKMAFSVRMKPLDVPIYEPGKPIAEIRERYGLDAVIKLASNENPYGPSPKVQEALLARLSADPELWLRYPDGAARELKRALSLRWGHSAEGIAVGPAADELIQLIALRFLADGDEAVMGELSFPMYPIATRIAGGVPIPVPMGPEGRLDLPAMLRAIGPRTRIVWLANPNNPTGTVFDREQWAAFLAEVPETVLVVLDEAYAEYVSDPNYPDGPAAVRRHPNVVVLRTFSKAYGLAGFRIGYALAAPEVVRELERVRKPFNTSAVAQLAATLALEDEAHVAFVREANRKARAALRQALEARGFRPYPSETNFLYLPHDDGRGLATRLEAAGVIVRPVPGGIRVSVGTEAENARLLAALDALEGRRR